jgi:hypothetical protein
VHNTRSGTGLYGIVPSTTSPINGSVATAISPVKTGGVAEHRWENVA